MKIKIEMLSKHIATPEETGKGTGVYILPLHGPKHYERRAITVFRTKVDIKVPKGYVMEMYDNRDVRREYGIKLVGGVVLRSSIDKGEIMLEFDYSNFNWVEDRNLPIHKLVLFRMAKAGVKCDWDTEGA